MTKTNIYHINNSKTCELAHQLTEYECLRQGLEIEKIDENNELIYPDEVQVIFDKYVNMIENIMLDEEIQKEKIEVDISEEDMEDLKSGKTFNWTFDGLKYDLPIDIEITTN